MVMMRGATFLPVLAVLAGGGAACDSTAPTSPTDSTFARPCLADVEMLQWRHYRRTPGSPAIHFAVQFRVTRATRGCIGDLDFRFKLTQPGRVSNVRSGGTWVYRSGMETDDWWVGGPNGSYIASLPHSDPYRIAWTWAWCWRVPPRTTRQPCDADEP